MMHRSIGSAVRRGGPRSLSKATSFAELMVVATIMMILLSWGIPQYHQAVEQSRVDMVGSNLLMIWTAQRIYWVSQSAYAATTQALVDKNLLDGGSAPGSGSDDKYTYAIPTSSAVAFTATAARNSGDRWSGTLTINQLGTITGVITDEKVNLEPSRNALGL